MTESLRITDKHGYLFRDYMLFHLSDRKNDEHTFHYHEFDKIVVLLSGKASYIIEGTEYFLQPYDILLVSHHSIHMPVIDNSEDYNRIVIWINRDFISRHSTRESDLSLCFDITSKSHRSLLHPSDPELAGSLKEALLRFEAATHDSGYAAPVIADARMLEYLALVNRLAISDTGYDAGSRCRYDSKISEIIQYINENLEGELTLEAVSKRFYISQSYLMHKFKTETGYTLHNYVLQKRLLRSKQLLAEGIPVGEVARDCGFPEYTTFLRAFKRQFSCLPKDIVP